ncbi:hypothetical protein SAMN05444413_101501 [Roseivivax marinus]|nr:hypothetical protein SAMN05444413_101501 [Roseivivax marinus]
MAMTAMENELLGYVEQLTKASQDSAKALRDCETHLSGKIEPRLDGLVACVNALLDSQIALSGALAGWLTDEMSYAQASKDFAKSLEAAKAAEKRLNRA